MPRTLLFLLLLALASASRAAEAPVPADAPALLLPATPALTPDGKTLVFEWQEDLWVVPVEGGEPLPLTRNPAVERYPVVSPDGTQVAFMSNRTGAYQVWVIPLRGGEARQITRNADGGIPHDWSPDGKRLLLRAVRDSGDAQPHRLYWINADGSGAERMLFDEPGDWARVSPGGDRVIYMHGGEDPYRRGYRGSRAAALWVWEAATGTFTNAVSAADQADCRWPLWRPDGRGFYFVREDASGNPNVYEKDLAGGEERQRTFAGRGGVFFPALSRDGSVMVFRSGFDFHSWRPGTDAPPVRIPLRPPSDSFAPAPRRVSLSQIGNHDVRGSLDFTPSGEEMVFSAGGSLWAMDPELREPVAITAGDGAQDSHAFFAPGQTNTVWFLRDTGDGCNLWKAERADPSLPWWRNLEFRLSPLTRDDRGRDSLRPDPTGRRVAWTEAPGSLWVGTPGSNDAVRVMAAPEVGGYSWSPDGNWLACSAMDSDDHYNIWILSADGTREPFNLSRQSNWDGNPVWSPDGRVIAWVGRRYDGTYPIQYAWLRAEDRGRTRRDLPPEEKRDGNKGGGTPEVRIDFEELPDAVESLALGGIPSNLFWSWDGRALGFGANREGRNGTWKIFFPFPEKAEFMTASRGELTDWTAKGIRWAVDGVPALYERKLPFTVHIERDPREWQRLALRKMWRSLRDEFYDEKLNNLDWPAVLANYEAAAGRVDMAGFNRITAMLFGELNASHLDFTPRKTAPAGWEPRTGHLGVVFAPDHPGPGLRIQAVLPGAPADREITRLLPGDILLRVSGLEVGPETDLAPLLRGPFPRDVVLDVQRGDISLALRLPLVDTARARELARDLEIETARKKVHALSQGKAGYIHLAAMREEDLRQFEKEVYEEGRGREGLVIDVRGNRGGFVADQILNILIYPRHATTIPRGGEPGYPALYLRRPSWTKPVTVLCNENTFSNGEIFSHAIKATRRGKLVGRTTAGGVISTRDRDILDLGTFRVPLRGWFALPHGTDMETRGAEPDVLVANPPGSRAAGADPQLETAVKVLMEEVQVEILKQDLKYASRIPATTPADPPAAPPTPEPAPPSTPGPPIAPPPVEPPAPEPDPPAATGATKQTPEAGAAPRRAP